MAKRGRVFTAGSAGQDIYTCPRVQRSSCKTPPLINPSAAISDLALCEIASEQSRMHTLKRNEIDRQLL